MFLSNSSIWPESPARNFGDSRRGAAAEALHPALSQWERVGVRGKNTTEKCDFQMSTTKRRLAWNDANTFIPTGLSTYFR
jgi:hypothetical protein